MLQIITGLEKAGVQFILFGDAKTWQGITPTGVTFIQLESAASSRAMASVRNLLRIRRFLKHSPMLVHSHGVSAALTGCLAARWAGCPSLFTAHNVMGQSSWHRHFISPILRSSNLAIAVTSAVKQSLTLAGLRPETIEVISNGIAHEPPPCEPCSVILKRYGLPQTRPVILAAGRLSHEKGFDLLIQSARQLLQSAPDVVIAVAGDGPELGNLRTLINTLSLQESVFLLGHTTELRSLMHCVEMMVIPSRSEGQSLVALEAMDAGCPVVAFKTGGLGETLEDGKAGRLVDMNSTDALAAEILNLHNSSEDREQIILAARKHLLRTGMAATMCERTFTVYERLESEWRIH